MLVQDYPVTELYGCQPGYPLNTNLCPPGQGFHNGIDYGCPTGTPIIVNGVMIGISGATGEVTGPHCHVGRWVGGSSTDPGVGNGFSFKSAVVTEIGSDPVNGNYVRVQGDGASWVYLHMSDNSKVSAGQVLQSGQPQGDDMVDDNFINQQFIAWLGRPATEVDYGYHRGKDCKQFTDELAGSPERDTFTRMRIAKLYQSALQRAVTEPEIQNWFGVAEVALFTGICDSDEAKAVTAKYNSGGAVDKQSVLGYVNKNLQ